MKDKSLLQALILGLGQIASKVLSLIFIFRFSKDLGQDGMSIYAYTYVPFSIFADLSTFGFIPGVSKLCSGLLSENKELEVSYLFKKGVKLAFIIGIIFFIFMFIFSSQIIQISLFEKNSLIATQNMKLGVLRLEERIGHLASNNMNYESLLEEVINTQLSVFKKLYLKDREIENIIVVDDYVSFLMQKYEREGIPKT